MAKITQAFVSAKQWFDAEENDKKPSAIDSNENITNETANPGNIISPLIDNPSASINNITSPSFTINSVGNNNFLGTHTPGVPIQASVGDSTVVISPTNDDVTVSQTFFETTIVKNASITTTNSNPYLRQHGGRRHYIPGPPTISKYIITLPPSTITHEFQIKNIIGDLLKAMQVVDPLAKILAHVDKSAHKLSDVSHIPQTDKEMDLYIEDPHTISSDKYGKLSARLTFETSLAFPIIKRDARFATWILQEGLFFDRSKLPSPRIKYIAFFDKKLPHGTRIPFFTSLICKLVHIGKPFKISSTLVKASDDSDVQAYAYLL
jgi:hypothetical protein